MTDIAGASGIISDHHLSLKYGADIVRQLVDGYAATGTDIEGA